MLDVVGDGGWGKISSVNTETGSPNMIFVSCNSCGMLEETEIRHLHE